MAQNPFSIRTLGLKPPRRSKSTQLQMRGVRFRRIRSNALRKMKGGPPPPSAELSKIPEKIPSKMPMPNWMPQSLTLTASPRKMTFWRSFWL